jgi:hypothetical protein
MKVKGIVESVTQESIEGWVVVFDDYNNIVEEPVIELNVNGQVIAKTFAVRETTHLNIINNNCGFRLLIKDLYEYINEGDELTISTCGDSIPFYSYGLSYKPKSSGSYNVNDLFLKLREGYVFDINGELKLSLRKNEKFRRDSIALYQELNSYFERHLSSKLFACYGTLLGVARENDFISNDGNFDCAYFSSKRKKEDVIDEFKYISKSLIKAGYNIKVEDSHIQVSRNGRISYINIYCSWLNDKCQFMLSYHYLGNAIINRENSFELQTSVISGKK